MFETESGTVLVTDFMPIREKHSDIVRLARCLDGCVVMRMELTLRFDYGRTVPWVSLAEDGSWSASAGPSVVYLRTLETLQTEDGAAFAAMTLSKGDEVSFVLTCTRAEEAAPERVNAHKALADTETFWTKWCATNRYKGPWHDAIERSLITLKALTYRPSGGIIAAPTTSLPEVIGAGRNWDYRYGWLRDASFTLESLLSFGYHEEAEAWQQWLLRSIGVAAEQMQIMYGMRGERHLPESELKWLPGYRLSRPVRIGNAASEQLQLDVFGETADALFSMKAANVPDDDQVRKLRIGLAEYVSTIWHRPSYGIWEERKHQRHFVYSKIMAWVTVDRTIRGIESQCLTGSVSRWEKLRDSMHEEICKRGFNPRRQCFGRYYGTSRVDASALLIPICGFLPFTDDRVLGTVRMIEKKLMKEGLLVRQERRFGKKMDSCFLAASFWLVQNYAMSGRLLEARSLYERLLALRNDVGLLSEEYDSSEHKLLGNYPQALSHIALINAGRAIAERQGTMNDVQGEDRASRRNVGNKENKPRRFFTDSFDGFDMFCDRTESTAMPGN
ncbi:glucoamylase [Edaphobacter acidisoli]|uniref:Glucoamylase n=2 Tax=Edaphobacter acidisoli TaxID=2040573 RepID=A0A916S285_9BACT|nr:glucoamylase [Edaphobacter acidisoli]